LLPQTLLVERGDAAGKGNMATGALSFENDLPSDATDAQASPRGSGGETVGAKPAPLGDAPTGQLLNNDEETVRCATCSVAQLLDYKRSTVDAFLSAVGPDVLARSVVGRQPLRDVWALRFLTGFKWDPKVAAEKFTRMVQYRVDNQLDSVRSRMEEGSLLPRQFPGFEVHHRSYVHSSFDVCSGRARGGRPLSIERVAKFDWAALFAIDEATQDAYMMHVMEWYSQLHVNTQGMHAWCGTNKYVRTCALYTYIYVKTHTYIYLCICIYIYTHTYSHA
jgi:hypothetical protein